jgi:hypothetical protein
MAKKVSFGKKPKKRMKSPAMMAKKAATRQKWRDNRGIGGS